jgi:hypothetical protein
MRFSISALLLVVAWNAAACGICIDDKIASCYDHAVVTSAKAKGHAVAFFAIKGDIVRSRETRAAVLAAIASVPGVERATGRVSLENAALSFAFDPARTTPEAARQELERRLGVKRIGVAHLRTI